MTDATYETVGGRRVRTSKRNGRWSVAFEKAVKKGALPVPTGHRLTNRGIEEIKPYMTTRERNKIPARVFKEAGFTKKQPFKSSTHRRWKRSE
jgi:hypothetical protein